MLLLPYVCRPSVGWRSASLRRSTTLWLWRLTSPITSQRTTRYTHTHTQLTDGDSWTLELLAGRHGNWWGAKLMLGCCRRALGPYWSHQPPLLDMPEDSHSHTPSLSLLTLSVCLSLPLYYQCTFFLLSLSNSHSSIWLQLKIYNFL